MIQSSRFTFKQSEVMYWLKTYIIFAPESLVGRNPFIELADIHTVGIALDHHGAMSVIHRYGVLVLFESNQRKRIDRR